MATIIKQGARKPLVEKGAICAGLTTQYAPSNSPGFVTAVVGIGIVIHDPATRKDYTVEISQREALNIIEQLAAKLREVRDA